MEIKDQRTRNHFGLHIHEAVGFVCAICVAAPRTQEDQTFFFILASICVKRSHLCFVGVAKFDFPKKVGKLSPIWDL